MKLKDGVEMMSIFSYSRHVGSPILHFMIFIETLEDHKKMLKGNQKTYIQIKKKKNTATKLHLNLKLMFPVITLKFQFNPQHTFSQACLHALFVMSLFRSLSWNQ